METITTVEGLRNRILSLESRRAAEELELRNLFKAAQESLKPVNLIVSAIKDFSSSPELKGNLLNMVLGMGAGFLSRKMVFGSTANPIKGILGKMLEGAVANGVSNNADTIKTTVMELIQKFLSKEKNSTTYNPEASHDEQHT